MTCEDVLLIQFMYINMNSSVTCISWYPWHSEEDIRFPGTKVKGCCEPPCEFWEWNQGPLQEKKQALLTAELSTAVFDTNNLS